MSLHASGGLSLNDVDRLSNLCLAQHHFTDDIEIVLRVTDRELQIAEESFALYLLVHSSDLVPVGRCLITQKLLILILGIFCCTINSLFVSSAKLMYIYIISQTQFMTKSLT